MVPASTIRTRSAEGEPAMTRLLALVLCLGLALLVAVAPAAAQTPPAPAQAPMVWKMGTAIGPDSPPNLAAAVLDKTLQEKSKGRMKIELHIANSLAKGEAAHLEGPQLGTIDIVPIGSAPIGGMFEPLYQALDLPFLWSSREQVWKVMDGPLGQELLKKMEAMGLPQHDVEQARDLHARGHEGPDHPRAGVAHLHLAHEGAGRQPRPDALRRGLPRHEAGHHRRDGAALLHRHRGQVPGGNQVLLAHAALLPAHRLVRQPQEVPGAAAGSPEGGGRVDAGRLRGEPPDRGRAREVGIR